MFYDNLILLISALFLIWIGSGLIVKYVNLLSKNLKVSSFALSFFILGILTSIPEFAVGLNSVSENKPEIFAGNLLGGIVVIFLFIIPFLAVVGNGVELKHQLHKNNLLLALIVIALPSLFVLDKQMTNLEGLLMIASYGVLFYFVERRKGVFDEENSEILNLQKYSFMDIMRVLLGVGLVFISSNVIVDKTVYFSELLHMSPFYISLVLLALGTNLPEFSLAVRSVFRGKRDVALGDYIGSAAVNTLLFGVFTLLMQGESIPVNNLFFTFFFIIISLGFFYYFAKYKRALSRSEGVLMLLMYAIFVVVQLLPGF